MKRKRKTTAVQKRTQQPQALARFAFRRLQAQLPLSFPLDPTLPPSPKRRYRNQYRHQGCAELQQPQSWQTLSSFQLALRLFDFSPLEPLLAHQLYAPSAKGQTPFHPVSMWLLALFRRDQQLSRPEALRRLAHPSEGRDLRQQLGWGQGDPLPSEAGLRYFERQLSPRLQQELNALQLDALYQAGLLPTCAPAGQPVALSFDGMLHQARSRQRCAHVREPCYQAAPRPCRAQAKGKKGCDCREEQCADRCRHAPRWDPQARLVVYSGHKHQAKRGPNTPPAEEAGQARRKRVVYGYYSYAGQLLDDQLATYWALPAAFGPATTGDRTLFPLNFRYLQSRFSWLQISEVLADAGAGYQNCLNLIWQAGALRLVDIISHQLDTDPETQLKRGYDENGHPLCPRGYVLHPNGHDYERRRSKWRCAQRCRLDPEPQNTDCPYLAPEHKHGYTLAVGRTHADGSVRLAREIPYGSPTWKERYHRRNAAESRNGALERLGLKRLPVHGLALSHTIVLLADFLVNLRTLVRLVRQASARGLVD
jgi:hypothetical protein